MTQVNAPVQNLLVIDSQVSNWQSLAAGVGTDTSVLILDSGSDGLLQISDYLTTLAASTQDFIPLQSLQIISHGSAGSLLLGSSTLTTSSLKHYTSQLASIGSSLTATGDILLYGCNVAAGQSGLDFINLFSSLTSADVAASNDVTGSAALGGNWQLEASTGSIEATGVLSANTQATYAGSLATIIPVVTVTAGIKPVEGAAGSFTVTLDSPAPAGGLTINYSMSGTANLNTDYTVTAGANISAVTNGSLTIAEGQTTASLTINAAGLDGYDPNETIDLSLHAGNGYSFGSNATTFAPKVDLATDSNILSVSVGDFNGDGKLDLAVANNGSNTVSVLLRNTANTGFDPKVDLATGSNPISVSIGDFNGNGKLDLAVANLVSNTVSVLLRNTDNTGFDPKVDFATGVSPHSISVGDFNGDGKTDIAVANSGSNTVSVLLRNAANTGFDPKVDIATGSHPRSVSVGDFNGDGKNDLAVANLYSSTVSVLLRNAANTGFDPKVDFATGVSPDSISVGDFNGDGKTDIAVANSGGNTVSVLLRNAANTGFDPKIDVATGSNPISVSVGDFNGDGKLDLAVANYNSNTVSVLLRNTANTGFDPKVDFATGVSPDSISVGDFNGDGKLDLAVANYGSSTVSVLLNNTTPNATLIITDNNPASVTITDNLSGTANRATSSIAYNLAFSEAVTGLDTTDFTLTNGTVSSVTGSGSSWAVNVTPALGVSTGSIGLTLKAGAVSDGSGNLNASVTNSSQAIDTVAPVAPKLITNAAFNALIDPQLTLQTSLGAVVLDLNPALAPVTVANMLAYANTGFYDNTLFHRVIAGFMVQGGGFTSGLVNVTPTYNPIVLESNNGLSNLRGTIAMARTNAADSATAQFFVNLVDNAFLNYSSSASPGYAVFGKVVSGMSVIDSIAQVPTKTVIPYANVPVTDVTITSAQQTLAGSSITNAATLTVSDLEVGAQWNYSLDSGSTWTAGTGNSFVVPVGNYAASAIQVRQTDAAGNVSASAGKLTSALVVDTTAPTITGFSPADGNTDAALANNIVLTFSEAIQKGTGLIQLHSGSATGTVIESFAAASSNRLALSGNTLTIDPTNTLANNTHYFITFESGSVKDLAGNNYAGVSCYDFTTVSSETNGDDSIKGTGSDDVINALAGNDSIYGSLGNDRIDGGTGNDTVLYDFNKNAITEVGQSSDGTLMIKSAEGTDTLLNIENLSFLDGGLSINELLAQSAPVPLFTSSASDGTSSYVMPTKYTGPVTFLDYQLLGNAIGDVITGSTGNDFINLLGGDDAANGGAGNDVLDGGTGSNFLTGGSGNDTIFLDGRGGTTTWSTVTDFSAGDQVNIWGWNAGVSKQVLALENQGADGYKGATFHYDLNNDGLIDTSITLTGLALSQVPAGVAHTVAGNGYLFIG